MNKKHFIIKILIFFLLVGAIIGVERLSYYLTDGFGIASITSNLPSHPAWDTMISQKDLLETEKALCQEYSYLTSGSQSYVFLSADGKYVIKFFKHKRWQLNPFYSYVPLPPLWEKKRARWKQKKWGTINNTFKSCKASYDLFKKETGVLYIHLNKTNNLKKILTIKDRISIKHKLKLDQFQFIIQRKAIPTDIYLLELRKAGKTEEAKKAVKEMLSFTKMRAELGYSDKDPHLIRNFGFLEGKALQIDIGGFHKDPKKDLKYYRSHELFKIQDKLLPWIEKNYPEIASFTEKQIEILSN